MKPSLSIKTLYRSPVRTLLTFILLIVVTFAFFSQTAEYAVTAREFNNAAKQYCGVGSAEVAPPEVAPPLTDGSFSAYPFYIGADPRLAQLNTVDKVRYRPLTREQINAISALPYVSSVDMRYMTAGISDTFYRLDDGEYYYNYTARCVIEGTLTEVHYGDPAANIVDFSSNRLILEDYTILAGNPPRAVNNEKLTIFATPLEFQENVPVPMTGGLYARIPGVYTHNYLYDTEYIKNMRIGCRYVIVVRWDPLYEQYCFLSDHLTNSWCDAVQLIDGQADNYLDTESFAPLRELVEITNADMHTFDMVFTDDMRSILRFAEGDMEILDGCALNNKDSANRSTICVVSREFAETNQLKVGDTITMKVGTELFEQYKGLGAVAATRERYEPASIQVTLEIVGIYADTDSPNKQAQKANWSYSINTIFVPKSLLPADESQLAGHVFSPAEFSFMVENAWDIPAFLEESAPKFEEMGLRLIFNDDGWPEMARGFQTTRQISIIKIAVLSAAVAAATGFVVYLFVTRKKKEYAVARALGTSEKTAARALILPLMVVAVTAVLAGSIVAWMYTVQTITKSNTLSALKEYSVSTSIPAEAAIACIAGELLLTLLIAFILLRRIGGLSPLALLQENVSRQARERKNQRFKTQRRSEAVSATMTANPGPLVSITPNSGTTVKEAAASVVTKPVRGARKNGSLCFVLRYIWRHIRRAAGKSALAVLLAVLLCGVVGQLALMKQSYARLCADTVITANFIGGLPLTVVPQIKNSDCVRDSYYEVRETVELNSIETSLVFTNNITRYTGEEADITYADGYDASVLNKNGKTVIIGKTLTKILGLEPGDTVTVNPRGLLDRMQSQYISTYRQAHSNKDITDVEILALYQDEIARQINSITRTYTIAGVFTTPSGAYDVMAFTPGDYEAGTVVGKIIKLDVAEFTLADNKLVDEFRSFCEKMAGGKTSGVTFVMDTSKLEHLRNTQRLLETLYPIAVTAALLIGDFLCCLVIVQSSKEAAIMRIQGTTKGKTRSVLALEQVLLSIAGLIVGSAALLAYKGSGLSVVSPQLGLFAALYFAVILISAVTCSSLATRRNVLELLQTKE